MTIEHASIMHPGEILESCDLGKLPSGPRVLSQLVSAIRQPDVQLADVAELFHADPALTARVVSVCNSPYYSRGQPTVDIRDAILHLGLAEVSRIVQAATLTDFKKYPTHLYTRTADHFWERSLHTAFVAEEISGGKAAAYTAGITHLVGIWVLCTGDEIKFVLADRTDYEWMRETVRARDLARRPEHPREHGSKLPPRQLVAWVWRRPRSPGAAPDAQVHLGPGRDRRVS